MELIRYKAPYLLAVGAVITLLIAVCSHSATNNAPAVATSPDKFDWMGGQLKLMDQALANDSNGLLYVEGLLLNRAGWQSLLAAHESHDSSLAMADFDFRFWQNQVAMEVASSSNSLQKQIVCKWLYGSDRPPKDRTEQVSACLAKLRWRFAHKQLDVRTVSSSSNTLVIVSTASGADHRTSFVTSKCKGQVVLLPVKHEFVGIE